MSSVWKKHFLISMPADGKLEIVDHVCLLRKLNSHVQYMYIQFKFIKGDDNGYLREGIFPLYRKHYVKLCMCFEKVHAPYLLV